MLSESGSRALEDLLSAGDVTLSDIEISRLTNEMPSLTVVQSEDEFDWTSQRGKYRHIIADRSFDKAETTFLDKFLDINTVNIKRLAQLSTTYSLNGKLKTEPGYGSPDLSSLGLSISVAGNNEDMSRYRLKGSRRVLEFYGYLDQGVRNFDLGLTGVFNQKSIVANFKGKKDLALVYRITFNGREELGSRLYLQADGKSTLLDQDSNGRLVDFMRALEQFHDCKLTETSCNLVNLSRFEKSELYKGYC